jgi:hypothetical protein
MGGFSTVTPPNVINALANAIQNNNPEAVPSNYLLYVPVPYYAGQASADQVAAFIDNAIRNYGYVGAFAEFITNNPYGLWPPSAVGAFLSDLNMSQTSVALLLAYAGATQMAQALNNLSGNYTNVVIAFNIMSPVTGATVTANMYASQAVTILSHPVMPVTQAAMILGNSAMPPTQGGNIIDAMEAGTAVTILNIAVNYNITQVAQELSFVSPSQLANIAINSNMSATTLLQLITSGMAATAAQAMLYGLAQNYYYNKWINTVTANAGSTTIAANVTVVDPLFAQSLTVASGVTVTCGTWTCFFVTQSFNNYGTIVAYGAPGAPIIGANIGFGGTGGGGVDIIALTAVLGAIKIAGSPGGLGNSGAALYLNGVSGGAGMFYIVSGVTVPLGGAGGLGISGNPGGSAGANGGGGGSSGLYRGGPGGGAIVYSFMSANSMLTYIVQGLSDWWLINVLGENPSSVTPLTYMYGGGGGGGAGVAAAGVPGGGGGGGGGGEAIIYGFDIVSGNIDASGGIGGTTPDNGGGGGGGGGLVFVFYGATSGSVTASVNGGVGGVSSTGTYYGNTGASGTAYIAAVTVNG